METSHFVYGDAQRIFVNTDIGCSANCKYCYLSSLNIHGERKISAQQAIELVERSGYYKPGGQGSIISIGCYSECMDEGNVTDTIALVKYFTARDNFVQLATKKKIAESFFAQISHCANVEKRLWVFVSLPVITNFHLIEAATDPPDERIENFDACQRYHLKSALYIKPYLAGLTDQDIAAYSRLAAKYNVPAVVGEMLSTERTGKEAAVGEKRLFESKVNGMDEFIRQLEKSTKVYLHSVDCVK